MTRGVASALVLHGGRALNTPALSIRYELGISQSRRSIVSWLPARVAAMELHQIRYFLALCDELNVTRAAERCKVAPSSLTRAINALEAELGGALFHRERADTHLSRLGRKVKPLLEQAYRHAEAARHRADDFVQPHRRSGAKSRS